MKVGINGNPQANGNVIPNRNCGRVENVEINQLAEPNFLTNVHASPALHPGPE